MTCSFSYIKAKEWKHNNLKGLWGITYKIDGVRCLVRGGQVISRNGKPIYGTERIRSLLKEGCDYELFRHDFDTSSALARTINGQGFNPEDVYELSPNLDKRLSLPNKLDPEVADIELELSFALKRGYEGLILRQGDIWLKVKPKDSFDVEVTEVIPGKGKHSGRMGALMTPMGKVGTGFTDKERELDWKIGTLIEVECMEVTKDGKFRHPRFKRIRWDK